LQLDKNERSIFGYFPSSTKAQQAMKELQQADLVPGEGYMQIDRVSRHAVVSDSDYNNPVNNAATLHALTHYSDGGSDQDLNPLLAANDSESGSGVYDDNFAGKSFMVTLVTNKENVKQAVEIMKKYDANV
jgi:hypothetical protein